MCETVDPDSFLRDSLINVSKVEWPNHTGKHSLLYNCNVYFGCSHNCKYCYARLMTLHWSPGFDWTKVKVVENAPVLAMSDIKQPPGRIMFCSMTDPYQAIEEKTRLARRVLEIILNSEFYVLILTKSPLVTRDFDLIKRFRNVEVGFTITALHDIPEWERHAPSNTQRIEALKKAHDTGIRTFVSIEPWIPNITYPADIIRHLRENVDRWIIGSMQYMGVPKSYYSRRLPTLLSWLNSEKINYFLKKELRACLT